MDEKEQSYLIQILMEDTGCERSEAEFALALANNNVEKAIVKLGIIQKYIAVFKIKLLFPSDNFYGLLHIAINTKTNEILRFSLVFSYNPKSFEISAETDWFSFEKAIFAARLESGAMQDYTRKLEAPLKKYINRILSETKNMPNEEIIRAFFNPLNIKIEIIKEQVNTANFKKLPNFDPKPPKIHHASQGAFLHVEVKILEDPQGKPIEKITQGDNIMTLITDERDIAKHLVNLIGRQKEGDMIPIPAMVSKVSEKDGIYEIYLQYNSSISSLVLVRKGAIISIPDDDIAN